MSTSPVSVGLSSFGPLLPVTGAFAFPFTAYYLLLAQRVVQIRLRDEHYIGSDSSTAGTVGGSAEPNELLVATRSQANFAEYVPWAFMLAAVAELNGGDRRALKVGLAALFAFRVLHVDFGLRQQGTMGSGRPVGWYGTVGVIGALAGYSAWLVKAYYGL